MLVHNRIEWLAPVAIRVVHHDVDHDRQEPAQHRGAVAHLVAIEVLFQVAPPWTN